MVTLRNLFLSRLINVSYGRRCALPSSPAPSFLNAVALFSSFLLSLL